MKKSTVVSIKKIPFLDYIFNNKLLLLICLLFAFGLTLGTVLFSKSSVAQSLAGKLFGFIVNTHFSKPFWSIMFSSLFSDIVFLLVLFLTGTSLIGIFSAPALICIYGFLFSSVSSLLYGEYGLKGIAFNVLVMIPPSLIFVICIILSARESVAFAIVLSRLTLPRSMPVNLYIDFKNYCGRYIFLCFGIFVSALLDAVLSSVFTKLFDFTM